MRLAKYHKDEIVRKVMDIKYPTSKGDEILKELALELRSEVEKDIIEGWEKYSKYMSTSSSIYYHFMNSENSTDSICLNVKQYPYSNYNNERFMSKHYTWKNYKSLSKKAEKISDKYLKFIKEAKDFKLSLVGALSSITTDKKLKEHLPKLVKFLPIDKQCGLVPVTTFNDINKKLKGL